MNRESAGLDAHEQAGLLDALTAQRHDLLPSLDRVLALRNTATLIKEASGCDAGLVAEVDAGSGAVLRWLAGNRTPVLQDLVVPVGYGVGGRVLATRRPVRIDDYVTSRTITHQFDALAETEAMSGMLAVPITRDGTVTGEIVAIAYAALRGHGEFGDGAVRAVEGVAADASRALALAERAAEDQLNAVAAERGRMQAALHDSVGAMLFSIGAQVRDLHAGAGDQPQLRRRLVRLESDISAASLAFREALLALSESSPERALPIELAEHCRSFEARTGVTARFVQLGAIDPLEGERAAILIGAVREGLLNAEKHANAGTVVVSLGQVDGRVQVAVADDGSASTQDADQDPGAGLDIELLATRAARVGGNASVVRDEDGGTTLRIVVPVAG
ncbi:GAF domain-containing protein [Actinomycetes bacterium KLBMP 9759]